MKMHVSLVVLALLVAGLLFVDAQKSAKSERRTKAESTDVVDVAGEEGPDGPEDDTRPKRGKFGDKSENGITKKKNKTSSQPEGETEQRQEPPSGEGGERPEGGHKHGPRGKNGEVKSKAPKGNSSGINEDVSGASERGHKGRPNPAEN